MLKEQARSVEGVARVVDLGLIAGAFFLSASVADSQHLHGALAWLPGATLYTVPHPEAPPS